MELTHHENSLRLVTEHPAGLPLKSIKNSETDLLAFLKIARSLAESVAYLHSKRIIHKNLNPYNIYYDPDEDSVELAGFELAKEQGRDAFHANSSEAFDAELAYISPEQTGRMNRPVDQRTDLYSLGTVLYELLAERPPFITDDPLEMIHCHIAKKHTPLNVQSEKIPLVISRIVDKLLSTNTDNRYQSALGLIHDLHRCSTQLEAKTDIKEFQLGERDFSDKFNLSSNLYGREDDLSVLLKSYHDVKTGSAALVFVTGLSGMGKSALVNEVKKFVDQDKGFFIHGKYDQFKQNTPLSSLVDAFSQLIKRLLSESDVRKDYWKQKVLEAAGTNGKILIEVIPEVKLLIGEQPSLPELPVAEANTRFNLVFDNFVQVFAQEEHPLCIFMDDLQWIDSTTCQWIEDRFTSRQFKHLFLIAAYRDNEVRPSHPVMLMIEQLHQKGIETNTIKLEPLSSESIALLIADSLHINSKDCTDIADVIAKKTHGNPFFIRQILLSLHEKGAIRFSDQEQKWTYSIDQISQTTVSDNVMELMLELLYRLLDEVVDTLKIASCIGNNFDLETLSAATDQTAEQTTDQLSYAIQIGLIRSNGSSEKAGFSFQHDKIQQAAFSLLSSEESKQINLKIGGLLLKNTDPIELGDTVYDITDHLNSAIDIITDEAEISNLIQLNLSSSKRAQAATAYKPSRDYINQALQLTDSLIERPRSELSRQLYLQKAEAEHLCGNNEIAAEYYDKAVLEATTDLEKARVYLKKIHYYTNLGKFKEAYETGRIAISPLGVKLPAKFVPPQLIKELIQYRAKRGRRSIKDLIDVPEMMDKNQRMAVRLMANVTKSAFQIRPELSIVVASKLVNQYLTHGHADGSSVGFVAFGPIFHGAILNRKKSGFDFGQLTLDIVEKHKTYNYKPEIHFVVGYFAIPWLKPAKEMEDYWKIAYNSGLEIGDFFHASCAACGTTMSYFMRGVPFAENLNAAERYLDFLNKINYTDGIQTVRGIQQAIKNLKGETDSRTSYSDENFDEEAYVKSLSDFGSRHFAHYYYINKMRTLYLWGEMGQAYEMVSQSDIYLKDSPGMLHTAEHFLYKALILAEKCLSDKGVSKGKWKRTLSKINKRFKKYAENCPSNFLHKSQLINAEYNKVLGNMDTAQELYYAALETSKKYKYQHLSALINQKLAQYQQEKSNNRLAIIHLKDAIYDYNVLGASAYAAYLSENSNSSMDTNDLSLQTSGVMSGSGMSSHSNIDLSTILKSYQAISEQIRLKGLLSTMMKVIIENAGAERMVLLLKYEDKLNAEAECFADDDEVRILSKTEQREYSNFASSVVDQVFSTGEPMIIDDASTDEKYSNDSFINREKPRSLLCAPLTKMGQTIGVIYLENNLSSGVFTQDRIDLVVLLSGQVAISIENAKLYDNLEEKVIERTKELNVEKEKSDDLLLNILPDHIAQELKANGSAKAKQFKRATILFADFQNFSEICENLGAEELVSELNYFYTTFDNIVAENNVEKIKTIGDCYMCAGSLTDDENTSPHQTINVALAIQKFMKEESERRKVHGLPAFRLRIGLHTGPVIAGIVGLKKFAYDIWGDAVNIASRMESNSEIGKINISGDTFHYIKDDYDCTYRGEVTVKNKGIIDMYFVDGLKS